MSFLLSIYAFVQRLIAAAPKTTVAVLTLAATLISKFGFQVSEDQLATIVSTVVLVISILTHGAQKAEGKL